MNSRRLTMLLAAALLSGTASGAGVYNVSVDTTFLIGNLSGPFTMAFQLTDGSGVGDGNNTVTIDNFDFGSGGPDGSPNYVGGASGDTATSIILTDTEFFNEFTQGFTPGNVLSFNVTLTLNPNSNDTPDQFSFAILDGSLAGDTLLAADLDPTNFSIVGFSSDALSIPEPTITAIPEPATGWLALGACCFLLGLRARSAIRT